MISKWLYMPDCYQCPIKLLYRLAVGNAEDGNPDAFPWGICQRRKDLVRAGIKSFNGHHSCSDAWRFHLRVQNLNKKLIYTMSRPVLDPRRLLNGSSKTPSKFRFRDVFHRVRCCNKMGVSNAVFMLPSFLHASRLSPVKGELCALECRSAQTLHARLSSSVWYLVRNIACFEVRERRSTHLVWTGRMKIEKNVDRRDEINIR